MFFDNVNTAAPNTNTPAAEPVVPPPTLVSPPPAANPAAAVVPPVVTETTTPPAPAVTTPEATKAPETTPPVAKVVPEKYDLKLPEGSPLDPTVLTKIAEKAKADGLSNDEAQALVARESASAASYVETLQTKVKEQQVQWVDRCKTDAEIGGAKFQESVSNAQRALAKYASPEFVKELEMTGYGNHPELVRTFARIGAMIADDKMVLAGTQPSVKKSAAEIFYDNTPPQK